MGNWYRSSQSSCENCTEINFEMWLSSWNCIRHFRFHSSKISYKMCMQWYLMSWWHHQMETFSGLLDLCAENSPDTGEFPTQRPVTRNFDGFFDLCLTKRLSKQWWGWWFEFETPSCPLWGHRNVRYHRISSFYRPMSDEHMQCLYFLQIIFELAYFDCVFSGHIQGPVSISDKTSYRVISWSPESAGLVV